MSLTKKQLEAGWTEEAEAAYVKERNEAAASRIFGNLRNGIHPVTGKPLRPLVIEKSPGVHGWLRNSYDPHCHWRTPRRRGDF
jgi:hypothetical protein